MMDSHVWQVGRTTDQVLAIVFGVLIAPFYFDHPLPALLLLTTSIAFLLASGLFTLSNNDDTTDIAAERSDPASYTHTTAEADALFEISKLRYQEEERFGDRFHPRIIRLATLMIAVVTAWLLLTSSLIEHEQKETTTHQALSACCFVTAALAIRGWIHLWMASRSREYKHIANGAEMASQWQAAWEHASAWRDTIEDQTSTSQTRGLADDASIGNLHTITFKVQMAQMLLTVADENRKTNIRRQNHLNTVMSNIYLCGTLLAIGHTIRLWL